MKCNVRQRLSMDKTHKTVAAFQLLLSDAFLTSCRRYVKVKKTQIALRDACMDEMQRLFKDEFYQNPDNIMLAISKVQYVCDKLKINSIRPDMISKLKMDGRSCEDFGNAFLFIFLIAYYNVIDEHIKTYKTQCALIDATVQEYQKIILKFAVRSHYNIDMIVNTVCEAGFKSGALVRA